MRDPLVIAVAQPSTVGHDLRGNAGRHAEAIEAADADVVVFPEMSLTGYEFDADGVKPDDVRCRPLVDACRATGTVALVGAPVAARGGKSIGVLRFDEAGVAVAYRKMWLGRQETDVFIAGDRPTVTTVRGWRLGLAVCKDTGVRRHAADTTALGIDVYAAGVLEHASDAEVQPSRAQEIVREHGVWVAVASFAGPTGEGYGATAGGSSVWAPDGAMVAGVGPAPGLIAVAEIT